MTLSRADLELWAVRALSLHHAAPMVTVCPASGEPSVMAGTNLITLLGTVLQSKLQQLSHGTGNSAGKKGVIRRGGGGGMKEEKNKVRKWMNGIGGGKNKNKTKKLLEICR